MKWKYNITIIAVAVIACIIVLWWLKGCLSKTELSLDVDQGINITPQQITSIKAIGEWEFLAVTSEELVDTVRKGFISDDHLARIYYGTVRLGINMHQVEPRWIVATDDSITVTRPQPGLLDKDFIDEARTKSFYGSGKWSHQDREKLYQKAYRQMLRHSMTAENLQNARENGEELFRRMMKTMGFEHVNVQWR